MTDLILHDDVVHVLLEFIDAYDSNGQSPGPVPVDQTAPKPQRHSARRVRDQIVRLRGVVAELEARLQELTDGTSEQKSAPGEGTSPWKAVAQGCKMECLRARVENARLRRLVGEQHQFARKLEKKLARHRRTRSTVPGHSTPGVQLETTLRFVHRDGVEHKSSLRS